MHLIVASRDDEASTSMAEYFIENGPFREFSGDIYKSGDKVLAFIGKKHLYWEGPEELEKNSGMSFSDIIFLSRHSSAADIKSVTTHPTGNFRNSADLGGEPRRISTSYPEMMTAYLRYLKTRIEIPGVEVTFEATHHGPLIDIPNFYFEIGTTREQWKDTEILEACLDTVKKVSPGKGDNFVGVGGGHYMTKVTEYAVNNEVNVGHMISKHSLTEIDHEMVRMAIKKTPECRGFIVDRKGVKSNAKSIIDSIVDSDSLEKIVV